MAYYAQLAYVRNRLCLEVRVGLAWLALQPCATVRDYSKGNGVKGSLPVSVLSVPCLPGTQEYRTRSQLFLRLVKGASSDDVLYSRSARLTCNNSGAWRYQAARDGAPPTVLNRSLLPVEPPPGPSALFAAHHIVTALEPRNGADALQRIGYLCGLAPNSVANGVFLRRETAAKAGEGKATINTPGYNRLLLDQQRRPYLRVYHPSLHTRVHFKALGLFLGSTLVGERCNRPLFLGRLALVKQALIEGGPVPRDNSATEQDVPPGD